MADRHSATATSGAIAFATVGTTRFDAFTQHLDTKELQAALLHLGIRRLVVQKGKSEVAPVSRAAGLQVETFDFAQGLQAVR